jgi:hypothetical protein
MAISNNSTGLRPGVCTSSTRPTAPYEVQQTCTKCAEEKPLLDFYKDVRGRNGCMTKCKNCHNKICSANNKKNPEAGKASAARWRKNNPEKIKALNSATKSRRRKSERQLFSHDDWQSILRQYHLSCAYCGCGVNLTMDHVVPLIRGGRHSVGNIIPACRSCNSSKGGKFIIEWKKP